MCVKMTICAEITEQRYKDNELLLTKILLKILVIAVISCARRGTQLFLDKIFKLKSVSM